MEGSTTATGNTEWGIMHSRVSPTIRTLRSSVCRCVCVGCAIGGLWVCVRVLARERVYVKVCVHVCGLRECVWMCVCVCMCAPVRARARARARVCVCVCALACLCVLFCVHSSLLINSNHFLSVCLSLNHLPFLPPLLLVFLFLPRSFLFSPVKRALPASLCSVVIQTPQSVILSLPCPRTLTRCLIHA